MLKHVISRNLDAYIKLAYVCIQRNFKVPEVQIDGPIQRIICSRLYEMDIIELIPKFEQYCIVCYSWGWVNVASENYFAYYT